MTNQYKIINNEVFDKNQPWQLYCNGNLIKSYYSEEMAEGVMDKLIQLDSLKEEAPDLKILKTLEEFIKSI